MSAAAAEPERRPRLNPFAFPSDTAFRFGLLVAAVLGANLYVWQWIGSHAREAPQRAQRGHARVPRQLAFANATISRSSSQQHHDAFSDCTASALPLTGRGGWSAVRPRSSSSPPRSCSRLHSGSRAGASCARSRRPMRRPWSARLRSSPANRTSTLPRLYLEPARRVGRRSRVRTPGSLQRRRSAAGSSSSKRPTRRRSGRSSGTSSRTSGTATSRSRTSRSAVWYAFLLVAVLPFLVTLLDDGETLTNVTARLAVLALLVYLTRNAVLRSREVYADLRASVPDGPAGALRRVLEGLPRHGAAPLQPTAKRAPRSAGAGSLRSTTRGHSSRSAPSSPSRPA